jgi:Putative lumazine-binding
VNDEDLIRAAALDYFEGWYDADQTRVDRALHPRLVKRSAEQPGGERLGSDTSKEMMLDFVREGGGVADRTEEAIEVTVADVHRDIATAVVRSAQYREYLHLVRTTEGWQVVHAFWQFTGPASH